MRLLNVSYLEKLVVGGGLREAAAVLYGLLELGGLGDHVCGSFGGSCWVVDPLWCGLFGWDCWREELNSGMPDDVICTPPVVTAPRGTWTAGLIIFTEMMP